MWDGGRRWIGWRGWRLAGAEGRDDRAWASLGGVAVLIGLVVCLLIPMAPAVVDVLLALSVAVSLILVVSSVRVEHPMQLRWFPSMVLCATLFRLCINVSTTRLILSEGYAGEVVAAFAGAVVRRDLVIGAVIFVIITAVQFVVITRGASRMAEVAARFALDALPGHQGSIRDQVTLGRISGAQAVEEQARMLSRADFYGAMDGTSRFVRGDAVVGVLIVLVNLVGGVLVGTTRQGMSFSESLDVYGRLTIGDGLLAQIPALLVSLAAALLVARVEDRAAAKSRALLPRDPLVFAAPAATLTVLALWEDMPTLVFSSVALVLFGMALVGSLRGVHPRGAQADTRGICIELPRGSVVPSGETLRAYRRRIVTEYGVDPGLVRVARLGPDAAHARVRFRGRIMGSLGAPLVADETTLLRAVHGLVRRRARQLLDIEEMQRVVVDARRTHSALSEVAMEGMEIKDIQQVLCGFLGGGLPVPPAEEWLHALADGPEFRDPSRKEHWTEDLRRRTAPWWWLTVAGVTDQGSQWHRMSPDLELEIWEAIGRDPGGEWCFVCAARVERELVDKMMACGEAAGSPGVLVCQPRARARAEWLARRCDLSAFIVSESELDEAVPGWTSAKSSTWVPQA